MTNELGEDRDLKDERESEEYQAMCDQVRDEMWLDWHAEGEMNGAEPTGIAVHEETMRRLREKYESACGKD